MRLGTFGTDLDRSVDFRDKWEISSFGGFWHLRRVRSFLCDDGFHTLWQTMAQVPAAAVQTVWRAFGALGVRLDSFGTDLAHLVHFCGKSKFSIFDLVVRLWIWIWISDPNPKPNPNPNPKFC